MKRCTQCGEEKDDGEFYRAGRGRLRAACKACMRAAAVARYQANPDAARNRRYVARYGVTAAQVDAMRAEQGYRCAWCGTHEDDLETPLCVDHCHTTGVIRGLLCDSCNKGFGFIKESPATLRAALRYITRAYELIAIYDSERE